MKFFLCFMMNQTTTSIDFYDYNYNKHCWTPVRIEKYNCCNHLMIFIFYCHIHDKYWKHYEVYKWTFNKASNIEKYNLFRNIQNGIVYILLQLCWHFEIKSQCTRMWMNYFFYYHTFPLQWNIDFLFLVRNSHAV